MKHNLHKHNLHILEYVVFYLLEYAISESWDSHLGVFCGRLEKCDPLLIKISEFENLSHFNRNIKQIYDWFS